MSTEMILLVLHFVLAALAMVQIIAVLRISSAPHTDITQLEAKLTLVDNEIEKKLDGISIGNGDMLREFLPADGASMSFRVNSGLALLQEIMKSLQAFRASADEARNASRTAQDSFARVESRIGILQGTIDQIALAQARTAENQSKLFNIIQSSGPAGQITAGTDNAQTVTKTVGVDRANEGLDVTKVGVKKIEEGINELKNGDSK